MNILPVVIIAVACYTAGYIHGEWSSSITIYQLEIENNERTLDRKVPPKPVV